ncbi:Cellulase domain-containing protein/MMR_HSR1 domain-containing protein [Cephalotus follicularis]|uniref:mannan endo-1,4-beta-mannosidase n=1 Tax=Cephalotus follicularis TaxID=3775 RepID=A0A1Q3D5P8_CEPFO|nr:Cellulase domain-containing protein/MMR_HSR1 domain-containing protein [Cephalotus follicularis]
MALSTATLKQAPITELSIQISTTLTREKLFTTTADKKFTLFPRYLHRITKSHFRFQSTNTFKSTNINLLSSQKKQPPPRIEEDEEEEDDDDDESTLLSLSEKPDRNMALLDDYELEELDYDHGPNHRSGYVAVLGKPNVGKSTLANQMIGQKLSIVTDKPQTTRHRILGICSGTDYQMVLYDTPGVIEKKMHKLDSMMMKNVRSAAINADCIVVLVDACKSPEKIDEVLEEGIGNLEDKLPTLLVLNKKDMIKPGEIAKKLEQGKALKLLATAARLDIEDFLQKKVYLEVLPNSAGDGFIRTRGVHFLLNGYPYYANGFNAYWLMYVASDPSQRFKVTSAFHEAASHGLTVSRTWAFSDGGYRPLQYSPGLYNEQMFKGLDFVIAEARRYGIKLILSLANNYESFGGKKQYVNWARNQGQYLQSEDDFFRNPIVKGFYKNHIRTVLNRYNTFTRVHYKDDPTIMAWELMNEPRCTSDPSGRTIQAWIMEMASYVKSIDRNHLLEAGIEGFYGQSMPQKMRLNPGFNVGTDFIANNRVAGIDFATVHSYPDQWLSSSNDQQQLSFLNNWLNTHIQDAQYLIRKPILLAEFGKSWKNPDFSSYQRDLMLNTVYYKIFSSAARGGAASGGLFWQLLTEGMDSFRDGYEIVLSQSPSTANLITQQSHRLDQIRKKFVRMKDIARWKSARAARRGRWQGRNRGRHVGN